MHDTWLHAQKDPKLNCSHLQRSFRRSYITAGSTVWVHMSTSTLTNSLKSITGVWRHASPCVNTLPQTPAHKYSHLQKPTQGQSSSVPALHLACSHLLCLPHSMEHLDQLWVNISLCTPSLSPSLPVSVPHLLSSSPLCPSLCSRDVPLHQLFSACAYSTVTLKRAQQIEWVGEECMRYAWEVQRGSKRQGQDGRRTRTNIWGEEPTLCRYTGKLGATSAEWMKRGGSWLCSKENIDVRFLKNKKKHKLTQKGN